MLNLKRILLSAIKKQKLSVKFLVSSRASHKDLMLKHLKLLKQSLPDKVSVRIYTVSIRF